MIMDEITRRKLVKLQEDLKIISDELIELNDTYDEMKIMMKDNILIDNDMIESSEINIIEKEIISINKEIDNGIIPRLNNLI